MSELLIVEKFAILIQLKNYIDKSWKPFKQHLY